MSINHALYIARLLTPKTACALVCVECLAHPETETDNIRVRIFFKKKTVIGLKINVSVAKKKLAPDCGEQPGSTLQPHSNSILGDRKHQSIAQ